MSVVIKGNSNVNLDFSTGGRITGDFSNATAANRVFFQTSTANTFTAVGIITNGTGNYSEVSVLNSSDPANASIGYLAANGSTDIRLVSTLRGTGTYLPMTFFTAGSERVRIDTSGNVGVGVTPSAWGSDTRALQIFNRTSLSDLQSTTQLTNNGIWNGTNWVYRETAAAGNYNINGNSHVWRIAPSGTAGNTISFTQAMTLDASGNLGVGTTSPGARIQAAGDISSAGGRFRGNTSGTTLADGASTTVDGGFGGLLIIGLGSGSSAHFYCPYSTGTSLIRSDVVGTSFSATDSGTAVRIFKSNNSTTVTIKNSSGGSVVIYVTVYTGF